MKFAHWYKEQFRETLNEPLQSSDEISESDVVEALGGKTIPSAMRDYYRVAGNHWINENHNRLRDLSSLETRGNYTIFMEENQVVAEWAIRNVDLKADDPTVYQGQLNGSNYEWYPEKYTFSRFIIAMWRWTLTGEDPE